jgi:hypothetical protein
VFGAAGSVRTTRDIVQLNLVRTLGTDARVREIRAVTFLDEAASASRRAWPVTVTLVVLDGSQQTVTIPVRT